MSGSSEGLVISAAERRMLWFLAEHRMVLERQIAVLLDWPATKLDPRLTELEERGYLTRFIGWGGGPCCRIRNPGLSAVGSDLTAPRQSPGAFRHDVGVAWLWLLAHRGTFGPLDQVIGERRLRSEDMTQPDHPYSIRLGGYDSKGTPKRHYADLLLVDHRGRRLALELELSRKEVPRRETILAGYGSDRRLDAVVYFVERNRDGRQLGRSIEAAAARMGISDRIHLRTVPPIELDGRQEQEPHGSRRARGRNAPAEAAR